MSQYNLGKDIQQIIDRLERLEQGGRYPIHKPCSCLDSRSAIDDEEQEEQVGQLVWEGESPCRLADGKIEVKASKGWTWAKGRLCNGYCNWREKEHLTIWSNGNYLIETEIKCEHGYLFACTFKSTLKLKDSGGTLYETLSWSKGLGGTDDADIVKRGNTQRICDSYSQINAPVRYREATC